MSVIPLKTEGPDRTIVKGQEEFQLEGKAVLIQDLDESQLTALNAPNTSYDLRIGGQYRDHRERRIKEIPHDGVITFHPGAALIIQTHESLHLPRSMYGTIAPKVSLLQKGLSSTFSKVDPGYRGPLLITVFNLGKATVPLRKGEPFCALTLFDVGPGARLYNKGGKLLQGEPAEQPRVGMWKWLRLNPPVLAAVIAAGASVLAAGVNVIIFLMSHR